MELQKLFVSLALKGDEFKQGLEDAGRQAEGLRSRIGGAMGTAGRVATGAMLGIGAAAVAGFGLAMNSAISMNASLEQSTMQFTTLMGDADMAADHVAMLFELGAKTPFETGPIIQASKHLQVFGGAALNTQENLILIGDAAAAVGAPFDEVAFWTGRMYSAIQGGQPFGEAAMRLQELGLLTPEVRAQMEGLQASGAGVNEVWGAMEGQLGTFTGAMEMQATSWAGITSTLSDTLQMMAANALAPFFELAKSGISALTELFNSPAVQAGITTLAEKLTVIIQAIADFVTGLTSGRDVATVFGELAFKLAEAFGATRQEAVQVYTAVKQFITGLMEIVSPIAQAVTQFVSWKDVLIALGILVASVVIPAIIGIVTAMAPILLTVAAVIAVVALLRNAWENNWGGIQEKVGAVWAFLQPILAAVVEWVGVKVAAGIEQLRAFWVEKAWPAILAAVEWVWPILSGIFGAIVAVITDAIIPTVRDIYQFWVEKAWPAISQALSTAWEKVLKPVLNALKDFIIDTLLPTIKELATKWTGEWWPAIKTAVSEAWKNVIQPALKALSDFVVDTLIPAVKDLWKKWTEEWWPAIKTAVSEAWDTIKPIWESLKEFAMVTLPEAIGELRTKFDEAMTGIKGAIQPVKDIWDGLVTAVTGFWDWIKNKVFEFKINLPELPDWAIPGSPIPLHTAWREFANDMPGIGTDISSGFDAIADSFNEMINHRLGLGDAIGSIAGGFASHFERLVTDPMKERLDSLQGVLDDRMPGIAERWEGLTGFAMMDWNDRSQFDAVMASLYRLQRGVMPGSALAADVQASIDAMIERNGLEAEYIRQQERLMALEQARADMDFLKQQMELLGLMRDNNIPLAALGGLQLGLTADPGALMDVMVGVMETIVRNTQYELNDAFNQSPAVTSPTPGTGGASTMNVQTQNINGGQHIYLYDTEESELEQLGVLIR